MPMYFGYQAHRDHGLGWRTPRTGKQMQQDPAYTLNWSKLKMAAERMPLYWSIIELLQSAGCGPREIIQFFNALGIKV
jgi:hypothetical protein